MEFTIRHPGMLFVVSFAMLTIAVWLGTRLRGRVVDLEGPARGDFDMILGATLTLLGLIIGFSFSMAIGRYDQRKNLEEAEANAIGTAYVRADLLPAADGTRLRPLLRNYLDQRIVFYSTEDSDELALVRANTAKLQAGIWGAVQAPAAAQPTPITALVVVAINDVLNSQGYTQAAWWNRIPVAAWGLMMMMALCCNFLIGFGSRSQRGGFNLLIVLPLIVSVAFMLVADIDTPRRGIIKVAPQNLIDLAQSLRQ